MVKCLNSPELWLSWYRCAPLCEESMRGMESVIYNAGGFADAVVVVQDDEVSVVGIETQVIFPVIITIHCWVLWSETMHFPYQAVRQLVRMLSIVPL